MMRSISAVIAGFAVFILFGWLTHSLRGEDNDSTIDLFGSLVGLLLAGYIAAFIGRRAHATHALTAAALCAAVPAITGCFTGVHRDWGRWAVGAFTGVVFMTWSGLFRSWQVSHRPPPNTPLEPTPTAT